MQESSPGSSQGQSKHAMDIEGAEVGDLHHALLEVRTASFGKRLWIPILQKLHGDFRHKRNHSALRLRSLQYSNQLLASRERYSRIPYQQCCTSASAP